jgi:hypothetical protein
MYKTAPRYLSGVSVFYGDDITRRTLTGEVVFFIGQSTKGPKVPVVLTTIDSAVLLYGKNSPLLKTIYEFWDGYIDSPRAQEVQLVSLRVGGQNAILTTPLGVTISTADAYSNIEDDYYIFVDGRTSSQTVKAWDKSNQKVLDTALGISTGHLNVSGVFNGVQAVFGTDIDSDPLDVHYTIANILEYPIRKNVAAGYIQASTISASYNAGLDQTTLTMDVTSGLDAVSLLGGYVTIKTQQAATISYETVYYTSATVAGTTLTCFVDGEVQLAGIGYTVTGFISRFVLIKGDSELTADPRKKYELLRNGLLEIEQYTPDYIIPANISFNESDLYDKTIVLNTSLTSEVLSTDMFITVEGANNWLVAGDVNIFDGVFTDQLKYSSKVVDGTDYRVNLDFPSGLTVFSNAVSGSPTIVIGAVTESELDKLRKSGFLSINGIKVKYTNVAIDVGASKATITRDISFSGGGAAFSAGASVSKQTGEVGATYPGYVVSHTYSTLVNRELGIGFVKETDIGGAYTFEWSDIPANNYNLAHFGYLFANFCSEAAIGSNTPLCGMNVDISEVENANFSRTSILSWVGSYPYYVNVPGTDDKVSGVLTSGNGLLGDAVMAGTPIYNRSGLSDPSIGLYADPGLGLLLTAEGFIDGSISRDNFGNIVDLGKFLLVGAGLLTYTNGASLTSYIGACGSYSLGMLAGLPKSQGLSFARIGQTSNTTVTVIVHRKYYNDLAHMKYIVPTREKGLGWVINNGDSAARTDSEYKLISTTRVVKTIVENKRALLSSFIGKALNSYYFEAAKTKLADSFRSDVADGLLNGYSFDLQVERAATAIGKLYLKISLNPPFEITQITIDTVIDRTITNV